MRIATLILAALLGVGIVGSTATYAGSARQANVQLVKKGKAKHHKKKLAKKHAKKHHGKKTANA